jgi:hypothetical protein
MEDGHFKSAGYVHGGILSKPAASPIQPSFKAWPTILSVVYAKVFIPGSRDPQTLFWTCTLISHGKLDSQTFRVCS